MWKPEHRRTADRRGLRYPSDLTMLSGRWWGRQFRRPSAAAGGAK